MEILRATGHPGSISAKSVSDWERGWYTWPAKDVRPALCRVLKVQDPADLGFYKRRPARPAGSDDGQPGSASLLSLSPSDLADVEGLTGRLEVPGGRSFHGVELSALYQPVNESEDLAVAITPTPALVSTLGRPDRRTVLVAADRPRDDAIYLADGKQLVRRAMQRMEAQAVPTAYRLDDLAIGIIWAVVNTDAALLADDGALDAARQALIHYEELPASAATLTEVPEINDVSRQWLGSSFCARHITRYLGRLSSPPLFWTKDQRGEEASAWLLWTHKLDYLRQTSRRFANAQRAFCVPEHAVRTSPKYERVLLLLAMALMEAFGIEVLVTPDPELSEIEGFVLADDVIVASWLRGPSLWYVDAGAPPSRRATYSAIADQLSADSIISQPTAFRRLQAAAAYLDIPWTWFATRCRELAAVGVDGLAHPRSRLLSTKGLNTAIRYVAYLDRLATAEGADNASR
ncbi:XRE family transcriptional regulator [Kribbella caucasensis]|uniref:XRE family transcriptional regulator n=1 Tax=Kribbella caucasensis TaxID=2512215 RepID=UPI00105E8C43|nr:XRE family transcriptional regulator [Kribbella sp. VKM Ac-2527]